MRIRLTFHLVPVITLSLDIIQLFSSQRKETDDASQLNLFNSKTFEKGISQFEFIDHRDNRTLDQ